MTTERGTGGPTIDAATPDPRALPLRPPVHQADPRAVLWWTLRALPTIVVLLAAQLVGVLLFDGGVSVLLTVTAAVTLAAGVAYEIVVPRLLFRLHRWEVTDDAVYTLSGWLVREWRIAPISRVQTVDTEHGPLQQMLKLATVTVTTASARGPVKIAGLADGDARELARTLTETTQGHPGDAT
jgi:membrane protein YdbS with pleckstrin-like domain